MHDMRVRLNYWAILVATIACFAVDAAWYTAFLNQWLNGISRTMESLKSTGEGEYVPYAVALLLTAMLATAISCVTQLTGPQTAARGMKVGALVWLGFIFTTLGIEYTFEVRGALFAINAGFWLIGCILMGAIVGGWKTKAAKTTAAVTAEAAH